MFNQKLNLEQLLEFNNQLVVAMRGQANLVRTLALVSDHESRKLRAVMNHISRSVAEGATLSTAVAAQAHAFPQQYLRVVRAAESAPVPAVVLQEFSDYLGQILKLRYQLGLILAYPLLLLIVVYLLWITAGKFSVLGLVNFYREENVVLPQYLVLMENVMLNVWSWGWIPPVLIMILWLVWFTKFKMWEASGGGGLLYMFSPGIKRVLRLEQESSFISMFSSLLDQGVPFSQAAQISVEATGMISPKEAQGDWLNQIEDSRGSNSLLKWLVKMSSVNIDMRHSLRYAAKTYRSQADSALIWLKLITPIVFIGIIAGSLSLVIGLGVVHPYVVLMEFLMLPEGMSLNRP